MESKTDNTNKDNIINDLQLELEKEIKKRKRRTIIFIIIIIILLLLFLTIYRLGKIGYTNIPTISETYDEIKVIEVTQDNFEILKDTQIDIFANEKFNWEKKIAPRSSGQYKFYIKNVTEQNITYDIEFLDEMQNFINMKYRLKIDNIYIRGNKDNYVSINELGVENIIVPKDSINVFTLEWYWEDDDEKDTYVGSLQEDQYYTLRLYINASIYKNESKE